MGMGRQAAGLLPELAEHVANESGWIVATGTLSGVGGSTGHLLGDAVARRPRDDPRARRPKASGASRWPALASVARSRYAVAAETNGSAASRPSRRPPTSNRGAAAPRSSDARCRSPASSATRRTSWRPSARDDVFAIDPLGVDREDPPAASHGRPRDRRHRGSRTRTRATSSRRPTVEPNSSHPRCRPPTARRPAHGGDAC